MRKRKRLLILLVAGWIALAGCSGKNEVVDFELPEEAEHTLSFFGNKHEAANVKVIEDILNGYMEEKSEVMITYESLKGKEYYQALRDRAETGRLDDIFMVDHDTVLELSGNGYLADLSSVVEKSSFSQNMLSQMQSEDGNIYWVPTTVSAFGLYCNLDLLKKHGQSVPTNLGEWEAVCDYFISQNITPVIANNDISLKTLAIAKGFYPLYARRGQQEAFDRLNSGQDALSAYLEEGFSLAKTFCDRGYIDAARALTTEKTSDDLEQFAAGEAPFMLTGVWARPGYVAKAFLPGCALSGFGGRLCIGDQPGCAVECLSGRGKPGAGHGICIVFSQGGKYRAFCRQSIVFQPASGGFSAFAQGGTGNRKKLPEAYAGHRC